MRFCVIPARGGSKRIPRKNLRPFHGTPLVARAVVTALRAGCFDVVVVSTDDPEIREVALAAGAEVPFERPADLADDHAPTRPVINHAIEWMIAHRERPRVVCCLYPGTPMLTPERLREGLDRLEQGDWAFVFSALEYPHPIERAFHVGPGGGAVPVDPERLGFRTQDLEACFHDAGQFYWGWTDAFLKGIPSITSAGHPLVLPRSVAVDIDTEEDWALAELLFAAARKSTDG